MSIMSPSESTPLPSKVLQGLPSRKVDDDNVLPGFSDKVRRVRACSRATDKKSAGKTEPSGVQGCVEALLVTSLQGIWPGACQPAELSYSSRVEQKEYGLREDY